MVFFGGEWTSLFVSRLLVVERRVREDVVSLYVSVVVVRVIVWSGAVYRLSGVGIVDIRGIAVRVEYAGAF